MEAARRRLSLESRSNAAHRVIDSDRNVMEVARDLSPVEATLAEWVRRGEAPAGSCRQHQRGAARRSGAGGLARLSSLAPGEHTEAAQRARPQRPSRMPSLRRADPVRSLVPAGQDLPSQG